MLCYVCYTYHVLTVTGKNIRRTNIQTNTRITINNITLLYKNIYSFNNSGLLESKLVLNLLE